MMYDKIIRDPREMIKFADSLDNYIEDVRKACKKLEASISSSSTLINDDKGKEAARNIKIYLDAILSDLPASQETSNAIRKSAKTLLEAEVIHMGGCSSK